MRDVKAVGLAMLVLLGSTGCGAIAHDVAKQGTEGALESIQEHEAEKTAEEQATDDALARREAEQAARGMLDAVTRPETPPTAPGDPPSGGPVAEVPGGVLGHASGGTGTGGSGFETYSSTMASQVAKGLSAELERQLGPEGEGPLGQSLSATAGRMATTMVEQSRQELGSVFPECEGRQGAEAVACRDAALTRLGGAFSQGVAGGLVRSFQPWLLGLAFGGGLLVGMLVFLGLSVARLRREVEPLRERRHA
ncbi:hypothetical protein D7Y21_08800 [Corallococcus sp. AB045]|uniref:hypothetical protein n=1 Tax=Corallococcus sp. AB045 TaxID=2316719 RepID=UPI000EC968A0|nr:hypothetical protein [Corallococcus sp. AB045]RKH89912.1 hypothetical protein D7Y21_08800 [Corallococcus sp. AB045]